MANAARRTHPGVLDSNALSDLGALGASDAGREPIRWSHALGAWVVVGHAQVLQCLREPRLGSPRVDFHEGPLQGPGAELLQAFRKNNGTRLDDAGERVALRRQTAQAFTPQALEAWRPALVRVARALVREVRDAGRMDAVRALTGPLAARVLAEVLGIAERDRERFLSWARTLSDVQTPGAQPEGSGPVSLKALLATREFLDYLTPVLSERLLTPGTDLLSRLLQVEQPGPVGCEQRVAGIALMLVSGLSSFADQLGNALGELLAHPGALATPPACRPTLVEELLRLSPGVPVLHRTVQAPLELDGQALRMGDDVLVCLAAANRDPAVFPDAGRLDPARDTARQKHLGLGFGLHYRLDAPLLRCTLQVLVDVVLGELPGLRLEAERSPVLKARGLHVRGFESLPVCW